MPFAITRDKIRLHYEEVGSGTPLVFVHEFAGDWRAWEPQMRYFARRYRCVTFSFRGYSPSDPIVSYCCAVASALLRNSSTNQRSEPEPVPAMVSESARCGYLMPTHSVA